MCVSVRLCASLCVCLSACLSVCVCLCVCFLVLLAPPLTLSPYPFTPNGPPSFHSTKQSKAKQSKAKQSEATKQTPTSFFWLTTAPSRLGIWQARREFWLQAPQFLCRASNQGREQENAPQTNPCLFVFCCVFVTRSHPTTKLPSPSSPLLPFPLSSPFSPLPLHIIIKWQRWEAHIVCAKMPLMSSRRSSPCSVRRLLLLSLDLRCLACRLQEPTCTTAIHHSNDMAVSLPHCAPRCCHVHLLQRGIAKRTTSIHRPPSSQTRTPLPSSRKKTSNSHSNSKSSRSDARSAIFECDK